MPSVIVNSSYRISVLQRNFFKFKSLWRRKILSKKFCSCGRKLHIDDGVRFSGHSSISFGNRVTIGMGSKLEAVGCKDDLQIIIGDRVTLQSHCHIGAALSVTIGHRVVLAGGVYVTDHDHDLRSPEKGYFGTGQLIAEPVTIGDHAWLGERVIVLKGVDIGHHSVVGAGSVVAKSIPPYSIAVGVPAVVIRCYDHRNSQWIQTGS